MKKKTKKKLFLTKVTISSLNDFQMDLIRGGETNSEIPDYCQTLTRKPDSQQASCHSGIETCL